MNDMPAGRRRKWLMIAAEALLVLVIVGLMVATWLPAIVSRAAEDSGSAESAAGEAAEAVADD